MDPGAALDPAVGSHPAGATVAVRVVPRAPRSRVIGLHGGAVKIKVAAPPVEGAANDELCAFVAGLCGVRSSQVEILSGGRGREKVLLVRGVTREALREALSAA